MKISDSQLKALRTLFKYPQDSVMFNGHITGGHGVKFNLATVYALKSKGLVTPGGRISEEGKAIVSNIIAMERKSSGYRIINES